MRLENQEIEVRKQLNALQVKYEDLFKKYCDLGLKYEFLLKPKKPKANGTSQTDTTGQQMDILEAQAAKIDKMETKQYKRQSIELKFTTVIEGLD